jgi:anti-anti-sigma factor
MSSSSRANESTQILDAEAVRRAMAEAAAAGELYEAPMNIEVRREGPVSVVSLPSGRMPLDEAGFCRRVEEALGQSEVGLVIDLSGVPRLSSRMIKEFVRFKSLAEQRSRRFAIAGAEETVMRVLELMNLEKVLPLYPTATAATSAFTTDTR